MLTAFDTFCCRNFGRKHCARRDRPTKLIRARGSGSLYDIYVFGAADGTPVEVDSFDPAFEFNWGAYLPSGTGPTEFGLTDMNWTLGRDRDNKDAKTE